jgi:hypothetical protein
MADTERKSIGVNESTDRIFGGDGRFGYKLGEQKEWLGGGGEKVRREERQKKERKDSDR